MANFTKISKLFRSYGRCLLSKTNSSITVHDNVNSKIRMISVASHLRDLMEFFDDEKNWGATDVKSGRSWKKDELRIKSNTDLHKLWYVLLKERNMLLTMEQECKETVRLFPNPERLDKVEESMENLEEVVRERNRAYYELETGKSGEQQKETIIGILGIPEEYKDRLINKFTDISFMNDDVSEDKYTKIISERFNFCYCAEDYFKTLHTN